MKRWRVLAIIIAAIALLPLWMQLIKSVAPVETVDTVSVIPTGFEPMAYVRFLRAGGWRWVCNSLMVSSVATVGQSVIAALAAYAFAWKEFKGRDTIFWLMVVSMALPAQALLVPRFMLARQLGLTGYPGLMLAYLSVTGQIFLVRQFCKSLPREVIDAARVDGAGEARLFFQVAAPMMVPALVLVGVAAFVGTWLDLFWPMLFLRGDSMTLAPGLYWFHTTGVATDLGGSVWNMQEKLRQQMAGGIISFVPLLVLFLAFQKRLNEGYSESWVG